MTVQTGFRPKWQKAAHQDKPSRFQGPSEPQQASWSIPNHGFGDLQTKIMHSVHSPAGVTKTLMTAQAISTVSAFRAVIFGPPTAGSGTALQWKVVAIFVRFLGWWPAREREAIE
jgi:hypothetical protein